jgi:hypothetical protein
MVGRIQQVGTHHQVIVEKLGWAALIGPDSTHHRRQMDHEIGPCIGIQPIYIRPQPQIVLNTAWHKGSAAASSEGSHHMAA